VTQQVDPQAVKQEQREYWNQAAGGWRKHDEMFRQSTASVTRRLLELAAIAPGCRVLDIASGTGEPALPAAEIVGPPGYVLLTDQSQEMLAVAREKAERQGLRNVDFRVVDGEALEVGEESFDAALCRWGLMFMPDPVSCLRQAYRALKPGGRIAVATWGPPQLNPFVTVPMGILMKYTDVPRPEPGAPGIFAFAERDRLAAALSLAGFREIIAEDLELTVYQFDSGRDFWEYLQEMGPIARQVADLAPEVREQVGREIVAAATAGDRAGRVSLTGCTLLACGTR